MTRSIIIASAAAQTADPRRVVTTQLVVCHGGGADEKGGVIETHYKLCDGDHRRIHEMTLVEALGLEMRAQPICCPPQRVQGVFMPTLKEVLKWAKTRGVRVTCELKGPGTAKLTALLIRDMEMLETASVSSFDHQMTVAAKAAVPDLRSALLYGPRGVPENFCASAIEAGASQVDIRYDIVTADLVREAHSCGLRVMAWCRGHVAMEASGVKSDESYHAVHRRLVEAGCDVICTNRPELLAELKREYLEQTLR